MKYFNSSTGHLDRRDDNIVEEPSIGNGGDYSKGNSSLNSNGEGKRESGNSTKGDEANDIGGFDAETSHNNWRSTVQST